MLIRYLKFWPSRSRIVSFVALYLWSLIGICVVSVWTSWKC